MDSTLSLDLLKLALVVLLVLANGFVAAEFSLVSVRQTRIAELVAQEMSQQPRSRKRSKS
jgi:CBS domain containing-hemolysin-like protein